MKRKPAARVEISGAHWKALDRVANALTAVMGEGLSVANVTEAHAALHELDAIDGKEGRNND